MLSSLPRIQTKAFWRHLVKMLDIAAQTPELQVATCLLGSDQTADTRNDSLALGPTQKAWLCQPESSSGKRGNQPRWERCHFMWHTSQLAVGQAVTTEDIKHLITGVQPSKRKHSGPVNITSATDPDALCDALMQSFFVCFFF